MELNLLSHAQLNLRSEMEPNSHLCNFIPHLHRMTLRIQITYQYIDLTM